ncbi:MAG: class I SAM-dependent methyltransferase [Bryobacterales bacterium]|nr:class I SAM-dependent methyltransferase [Bryobacterales bacterium]
MTLTRAARRQHADVAHNGASGTPKASDVPGGRYGWQHPVNQFWYFHLYRNVLDALRRAGMFPLAERRILDVGCGEGLWPSSFLTWGASAGCLSGIDVSERRIDIARRRLPGMDLRCGDAGKLPWSDNSFDVVAAFVTFSSILDSGIRRSAASEMRRVLKPGGIILWYDFFHDSPRNRNVRGIRAGEVRELFPQCRVGFKKVTLAPPIARSIVPISWSAASLLNCCPLLRTHYFAVIQPDGDH